MERANAARQSGSAATSTEAAARDAERSSVGRRRQGAPRAAHCTASCVMSPKSTQRGTKIVLVTFRVTFSRPPSARARAPPRAADRATAIRRSFARARLCVSVTRASLCEAGPLASRNMLRCLLVLAAALPATLAASETPAIDSRPLTAWPAVLSHDAATGEAAAVEAFRAAARDNATGPVDDWSITQAGGLAQQLECGARALDYRPFCDAGEVRPLALGYASPAHHTLSRCMLTTAACALTDC